MLIKLKTKYDIFQEMEEETEGTDQQAIRVGEDSLAF